MVAQQFKNAGCSGGHTFTSVHPHGGLQCSNFSPQGIQRTLRPLAATSGSSIPTCSLSLLPLTLTLSQISTALTHGGFCSSQQGLAVMLVSFENTFLSKRKIMLLSLWPCLEIL